jgi:predicted MFS family arabinose efflux permease
VFFHKHPDMPSNALGENTPLIPAGSDNGSYDGSLAKQKTSQRYVFSRWQSFAGICLYISIVGTTYAYSVYSSLLEQDLGFSDEDLYIIASVGNTGLYMSLFGGLILEYCGLYCVVGIGAFLIFAGTLSVCVFFVIDLTLIFRVQDFCTSTWRYCRTFQQAWFPFRLRISSVSLACRVI